MRSPTRLLQDYLAALSAQDIAAIEKMSSLHSLVELPFIKPNRLLGSAEIVKAHREIFACVDKIHFEENSRQADAGHAIADGRLEVRRDGKQQSFAAAFVSAANGDEIGRVSLYCDARNIRPWSDKTIL